MSATSMPLLQPSNLTPPMPLVIRPATREDLAAFTAIEMKPTVKALAAEVDGKLLAVAGFAIAGGRYYAFCDLSSEEARPHKIAVARAARRLFAEARASSIRYIYAQCDPKEAGAERWLRSLGFVPDPRSTDFYRWSA